MPNSIDDQKQLAAARAVERVQSGMVVGLGSGSTAQYALVSISQKLQTKELQDLLGIPTSSGIEAQARNLGIPLTDLHAHPVVDLTIDGADEIDPELNLIKGGGAALLREKILAQASRELVIVADESKLSNRLGTLSKLPIEILPFGLGPLIQCIEALGARVGLRLDADGHPVETDQGNWILDCDFGPILKPELLGSELKIRAGIVEHGLFLGLAHEVIIAGVGGVRHLNSAS